MKQRHVALLGAASSIHLQRWAAALAARDWRVSLITQHAEDAVPLPEAVRLYSLPRRGELGYFLNAPALKALLRRLRPDLLNAHYASGYGSTAALSGFAPTLLSVWGSDVYDFPYESAAKGWLVRRNLRQATSIASTSEAMARQVRRLVSTLGEIAITPFGVQMDRFDAKPERRAGSALVIGTVKTLAPKYGVDLLLRAFAGLLDDADMRAAPLACRLLIVGDGPQRAELAKLADDLGIASLTEFAGTVKHDQVPAQLHRLDIYAAASRLDSESFGVAVVEASACALPVVVSDAGGLPEVVLDGETGLVVPRNDVHALQAAIKRLVFDASLRDRLGRAGRVHVGRAYEWEHCVDSMERCYERTIAQGAPP